jgi:S1-C subfamily serine protease
MSRREFAGYWEYLLEDAIFTAPPHAEFGGAALFGPDGSLLGIGSLFVADAVEEQPIPGNMFVPINALKPIMGDLLRHGRPVRPSKPWLGVYTQEVRGRLLVTRVAPDGPAAKAGVEANDVIVAAGGEQVQSQADFYRRVWALGEAGVGVPLTVFKPRGVAEITVASGNRYDYLRLKPSY